MIVLAHTVSNPGAVVVHSDDALLADRTVVDALLFDHIALETIADFVQCLNVLKIYLVVAAILASLLFLLGFGARVYLDLLDFLAVVHVLA